MSLFRRTRQASTLIEAYDLVLSDLDGVVYYGQEPVPGAVEALNAAAGRGRKVGYLTNNAARTPEAVAAQLRDLGLSARPDDVITSPQAAVPLLARRVEPGVEVLVVGSEGLERQVADAGFRAVRMAGPETRAVIQGFAPEVSWKDLAEASYAVGRGAVWIGTNNDWTIPKERGIAPGNGALMSTVHTATGVFPEIAGKPEPPIFEAALERFRPQRALMLGDRLDTDIAGAVRVGLDSALVLTGVDRAPQLLAAPEEHRPTYVLATLAELHEGYDPPMVGDGVVRCGGAEVVLDDRTVRIAAGDAGDVRTIRAAAALVWTCGVPLMGLTLPPEFR